MKFTITDNKDIIKPLGQWKLKVSAFALYKGWGLKDTEFVFEFNKEILN